MQEIKAHMNVAVEWKPFSSRSNGFKNTTRGTKIKFQNVYKFEELAIAA